MGNTCCQGMNCSGMNPDANAELNPMKRSTQFIDEE